MKTIQEQQPVLGKMDFNLIMKHLKSGQGRTLFNRYDAEELMAELKKAEVVDDSKLPPDIIRLNSTVRIRYHDEPKTAELMLVIPERADIKLKRISVMSPAGIALIGCRKGQVVTWKVPQGEKRFVIEDVIHE